MWDKTPGMYCFARAGWNNQQVTKNCGVLPFLFHQMYGWRAVMAGPRIEADYPGLAYVPGLEMDFLADARTESALAYLEAHQMDIDVLVFHGVFPNYIPLARCQLSCYAAAYRAEMASRCGISSQRVL